MTRARLIIAASEWRERRIRRAAERVLGAPCECGEARIGESHACDPESVEMGGEEMHPVWREGPEEVPC